MKKLPFTDKLIFFLNSLAGFVLLCCYILPYIPPKQYPLAPIFALATPGIILMNFCFVIYWVVKLKKQFLLSAILLALGYSYLNNFIEISEKKIFLNDDVKIMSYNVRLFNAYEWSKKDSLNFKIYDFIKDKDPDILAIQEHYLKEKHQIHYKYSYLKKPLHKRASASLGIYSKFPIINKGSLGFKNSGNNTIFCDLKFKKDTLRIYNIHLQSLSLDKNKENFGEENSEKLISIFKKSFTEQQNQVVQILEHANKSPYKNIFMGDFNNNAFSWVYKELSKNKKDAFKEAGSGLGKSFDYFFPFRIDFMLTDKSIQINNFKTYSVKYSDHYPIMARINLAN
jgi:endonuclease/exonuclease/phosphatase family metal-dependent hydrolase